MKKTNRILLIVLALAITLTTFVSCSGGPSKGEGEPMAGDAMENPCGLAYNRPADAVAEVMPGEIAPGTSTDNSVPGFQENAFISTQEEPISTFSADVDTASYTYFRKLVTNGYYLDAIIRQGTAFRTEEMINYFRYTANAPRDGELFGVTTAIIPTPWNADTLLMRLTLQAETILPEGGNNLVFLIDVSGSMGSSDKLPLLQRTFSYLISNLTSEDRVSIVTYSGQERVVLSGCPGNHGEEILAAINGLTANGSTNGEAGLKMAYSLAQDYFIEGGNNRIIMASDGDLNVGMSSAEELKSFVEAKRKTGVYLSVLGFGTGNYRDANMEALADNGNGAYYYIDGELEAEKVFGTDLLSTLYTVAEDVKLQITFDPAAVASYRLIGYENRILSTEDFEDDTKDAGEVGAGHQVTVLYELVTTAAAAESENWMKLAVRYKHPGASASLLNEYTIGAAAQVDTPDDDLAFMVALTETAMLLHKSSYLKDKDIHNVLDSLNALDLKEMPDRAQFRELIRTLALAQNTQ